jgi:hypothetical protein
VQKYEISSLSEQQKQEKLHRVAGIRNKIRNFAPILLK